MEKRDVATSPRTIFMTGIKIPALNPLIFIVVLNPTPVNEKDSIFLDSQASGRALTGGSPPD